MNHSIIIEVIILTTSACAGTILGYVIVHLVEKLRRKDS